MISGASADLGDPDNRVVAPGDPDRSVLLQRIQTLGPGRMPPLASNLIDTEAVALLTRWIEEDLANGTFRTFADWQVEFFDSIDAPEAAADFDADGDRAVNWFEFMTRTHPLDPDDVWKVQVGRNPDTVGFWIVLQFRHLPNRAFEIQSAESLENPDWRPLDIPANRRFFPAEGFLRRILTEPTGSARYFRVRVLEP